jgi:hypothetical protein
LNYSDLELSRYRQGRKMIDQHPSGTEAFIDKGFSDSKTFCTQFLYSSDFTLGTLKALVKRGKSKAKYELATSLAGSLESQQISKDEVLLAFVQQPRKWLSFKIGRCTQHPVHGSAEILLTEFGEEGWYGPIKDVDSSRVWYIRTHKVPFYEQGISQAGEALQGELLRQSSSVATYRIRWTVLAEIGVNYMALSWNGFRHNELRSSSVDPTVESLMQFPYWRYIPGFFDELSQSCSTEWQNPVLHKLVLQDLWDRYLNDSQYVWRHLRIRADNRGVALNVHSTGASDNEELQMRGLRALSKELASSALSSLEIQETSELIGSVENALLRTLIQNWGTKSYEFSLNRISKSIDKDKEIFRAHCYFSLGASSSPQDSFQHLHCFTKDYGGSGQALRFLLSELGY